MSNIFDLVDDSMTDKNTTHSYLGLYDDLLKDRRESARNVLEVGIGDFGEKNGGSIKLWKDYFPNATVYGLDILPIDRVMDELLEDPRVVLLTGVNAYDQRIVKEEFINKRNIKFDFLIDDGSHHLGDMKTFIKHYLPLMTDDGIMIIEDVPDVSWIGELVNEVPENMKHLVRAFDLRANKNRFDDLVFVIDKRF
jgi:8-demethyl-8-alpha-L-rhamnosyltetracenomycin-C 2'-O-methyltransferase